MAKVFSKAKWLESANRQMEEGYLSQREIDDALVGWVNNLDGKTQAEVEVSGMSIARDEWFV